MLPRHHGDRVGEPRGPLGSALRSNSCTGARWARRRAEGHRVPDKTDRTSVGLFATRATSGASGSPRRDVARSVMLARQEPRVDPEPHGGAPTGGGPDRLRPQPPQLCEAGERALDDPGLRQAGPLVPIHVPGRERAGQHGAHHGVSIMTSPRCSRISRSPLKMKHRVRSHRKFGYQSIQDATASTMASMAETLGMTLPGNAAIPAADSRRMALAEMSGRRIMEMVREDLKPSKILTREAFDNAIRTGMAIGGSTNANP